MKRIFFMFTVLFCAVVLSAQVIDKPIATVKLTKTEVLSIRQFKTDVERIEKSNGVKMTLEQRKEYLDARINDILFFQMCERERIQVSEGEINNQINTMKTQYGQNISDAQFEAALKAQGIQVSDVKTYVSQMMLLNKYLESKKSSEIKSIKEPTAEEILKVYELYKSQLIRPDAVRMSIIYIDTRNQTSEQKLKSRTLMQDIVKQVRSNPSKFDEFILKGAQTGTEYKATPSMIVGKTPETLKMYGQQFLDISFKLKNNEISELIENSLGLQIIRINEVYPQKQLMLTDDLQPGRSGTVQEYIRSQLMESKKQELLKRIMQDLFTSLRKEAKITTYEENLNF